VDAQRRQRAPGRGRLAAVRVCVQAAINYNEAFADEIAQAMDEYRAVDFTALKRLLPQAIEFSVGKAAKR